MKLTRETPPTAFSDVDLAIDRELARVSDAVSSTASTGQPVGAPRAASARLRRVRRG